MWASAFVFALIPRQILIKKLLSNYQCKKTWLIQLSAIGKTCLITIDSGLGSAYNMYFIANGNGNNE